MGPNGAEGRHGSGESDGTAVGVRLGGEHDASAAAHLHADRISDGFLSLLGPAFLTRLYRRIVRTPGSFLLVADDAGVVVGFVAGTADVGHLYRRFLVRDGVVAGIMAAPRLVRNWRQVRETLRHGSDDAGIGRGTEVLSMAVEPSHGGRGLGRALLEALLDRVVVEGGDSAYVVIGMVNRGAFDLHARVGFVPGPEFELHAGEISCLMQWDRGGTDGPGGTPT